MFLPQIEQENRSARLHALGFSSYAEYKRSGLWQVSLRRLRQGSCEACGNKRALALHHMTYVHLGAELMEDVCTLCASCHKRAHFAAMEGGSLYPEAVMRKREAGLPKTRQIAALEVSCPFCEAQKDRYCREPTGRVRGQEHKERRCAADAEFRARKEARKRRAAKKKARLAKLTVSQIESIRAAREAEFPLEELRKRAGRLAR